MRFHLGTAEIMGPSVAAWTRDAGRGPAGWGLAQLFLEEPATATWGQPFVVRGSSAMQTLGGGQVLQPVARKIRRRHLEILERIENSGPATPRSAAGRLVRRFRRVHEGRPGARGRHGCRRGGRADGRAHGREAIWSTIVTGGPRARPAARDILKELEERGADGVGGAARGSAR